MSDLAGQLIKQAPLYSFNQLLRILEKQNIHADCIVSLNKQFPASTVLYMTKSEDNKWHIHLAPLEYSNTHLLEKVLNQHCYNLLYAAWKKYLPSIAIELGQMDYINYLHALSAKQLDLSLLKYSHLFGARIHHGQALRYWLKHYLTPLPIQVHGHINTWQKKSNLNRLGENKQAMRLADNSMLGDYFLDATRQIRITIGPADWKSVYSLYRKSIANDQLVQLIQQYIGPTLTFTLQLLIRNESQKPPQLGDEQLTLAWSSYLGITALKEETIFMGNPGKYMV